MIHPTRQPVIAYVLATPLTMSVLPATSGTTPGIDVNRCFPYVRCS